jgi:hypothetical protein
MQYVAFYFWLLLLILAFLRFIHAMELARNLIFLWLSNIPQCVYTTFYLLIDLLIDICVVSSFSYYE